MAATQREFTQVGGGRFGFYWIAGNSNISFVKITISELAITMTTEALFSKHDYVFERSSIQRLEEHAGLICKGVRICHSNTEAPSLVVFRPSKFDELCDALTRFGYPFSKKNYLVPGSEV
jgi:hypothetical protein